MENQKRATSSVNLAALGKSQSVRFLDELPEHARTAAKGKARADKFDIDEDSEPGSPLAASPAIEESEDEDQPALPRTKSQLSMLIDKERKYSGGINIGSEPPKRGNRKGDSAEKKEDDGEDNELLMMARRDKKGKPKDPDQPFKAAAQKGLWKGGGGGPGSPPPIF